MKNRTIAWVLVALLALSPAVFAQRGSGATSAEPTVKEDTNFDPHDLNGSWVGTGRIYGDNNSVPEPPLTPWAKEHLLLKRTQPRKAPRPLDHLQEAVKLQMKMGFQRTCPVVITLVSTANHRVRR